MTLTRKSRPFFTSSRALPPATLASLTEQLGGPPTRIERDPHKALALARDLAGPEGAVLATGSIYLVADLLTPADDTEWLRQFHAGVRGGAPRRDP